MKARKKKSKAIQKKAKVVRQKAKVRKKIIKVGKKKPKLQRNVEFRHIYIRINSKFNLSDL